MKQIIIAAALLLSTSAFAGLTGTELSLRTLAQATSSSTPFTTSFERTVVVGSTVEYPNVESLFNPATGVPPGFAHSLVNTAIDVGDDYVEIDFDNAGFHTFASGFENTYVFRFDSAAIVDIKGAEIDSAVTTLGLRPSDVRFSGNELFINVESLPFNPSTFARVNLVVQGGPLPIPEPETYAMFLAGLGLMGLMVRRKQIKAWQGKKV